MPLTRSALEGITPLDRPLTRDEIAGNDTSIHLARIAHFVAHGWTDSVEIDVGCLGYQPAWILVDGNHRFAAAILRNDWRIDVGISGELNAAADMMNLRPADRFWVD